MTEPNVYVGKDLEAMSFAVNYHNWILDEFRPFLGKRLAEVGAGTGLFSKLLLGGKPESIALIEPSEMFETLAANVAGNENGTDVSLYRSIFTEVAAGIDADSIIYVNVLEHIEDDQAELHAIYKTLKPGGRCFIFVPAFMALYGKFDRRIGHFRRYRKTELEEKCRAAGFKIVKSKYFDFAGIFPWFLKYKILRSDSLESGAVKYYDRLAVPLVRKFEKIFKVPMGKSVLLIAEK